MQMIIENKKKQLKAIPPSDDSKQKPAKFMNNRSHSTAAGDHQ